MCGISGIISFGPRLNPKTIEVMTDIVRYRGPDDYGYLSVDTENGTATPFLAAGEVTSENCTMLLGHRRLSIIDLSTRGHQPMSYGHGRLWLSFNGEIYNYIEIRSELESVGHIFRTGTDTEVILAAYREWGEDCLNKFNGMWAFALLDLDRKIVFCARDRLGVKPFYYHYNGEFFSFGSEIKQLLTLSWVERAINLGPLFDFFVFDAYGATTEETFFSGITELRGGNYLSLPIGKGTRLHAASPVQWWDIDPAYKLNGLSDDEYASRYCELFTDSVRLRLRSDVPVGSCLSGGLDSSGIVCVANRILKETPGSVQKTFTSTSDYPDFDETEYAMEIIRATNVEPAFIQPTPERLLDEVENLTWHHDEPFLGTSIFAGWCIYMLSRSKDVVVTLDGQGPDEMMGGYLPSMYAALLAQDLLYGRAKDFWANLLGLRKRSGFSFSKMFSDVGRVVAKGWVPKALKPSLWEARKMLNPDFLEEGAKKSIYLNRFGHIECRNHFDHSLYFATKHGSLPGILRQVDRSSMAFSIEARLPYLDYRLVEYTFSLPTEQIIRGGIPKYVYRNAMKGILPEKIRNRTSKLGFVTAESEWLREKTGDAFLEVFSGIDDQAIYRRSYVVNRFSAYREGKAPFTTLFWKVFNTEHWMNTFIRRHKDLLA